MNCIPRFQGRVGRIESPPELEGKFCFEIFLSFIGDGKEPQSIFTSPPFDKESEAHMGLKRTVSEMVKVAQNTMGIPPTGDYLNLKTNRVENLEGEN